MKLPERAFIFFFLIMQIPVWGMTQNLHDMMGSEMVALVPAFIVWFVMRALWFLARGL